MPRDYGYNHVEGQTSWDLDTDTIARLTHEAPFVKPKMPLAQGKKLEWARFALSGALVGIAISGIVGPHLGWDKEAADTTGAVLGAGLTAILVKAIHIV